MDEASEKVKTLSALSEDLRFSLGMQFEQLGQLREMRMRVLKLLRTLSKLERYYSTVELLSRGRRGAGETGGRQDGEG